MYFALDGLGLLFMFDFGGLVALVYLRALRFDELLCKVTVC